MLSEDGVTEFRAAATGGDGVAVDASCGYSGFGVVLTCRDVRALIEELSTALHSEELQDESLG